MARIKQDQPSGKIGNVIYRQTRYGLVVAQAPAKPAKPSRSVKQMRIRTKMANLSANCRLYHDVAYSLGAYGLPLKADLFFEDKQPQHTLYNLFLKVNYNQCPVYLTQQETRVGGCVVASCQFSRGTLEPVAYGLKNENENQNENGVLVSNLKLGELVIDDDTTVAVLSEAIIGHNDGWQEGDELCFLHATQRTDEFSGVPRAEMQGWCLRLDTTDCASRRKVYDEVNPVGFSSLPLTAYCLQDGPSAGSGTYCLGMGKPLVDGGAAWLHLRRKCTRAQASPQRLYVVNPLYDQYRTEEAFEAAVKSYR
jgi:hypothetical protein